jgi:hypothetical protein
MSGRPGRSGGANRKSIEEHVAAGTLRPARHLKPAPPQGAPVNPGDRRRVLAGLPALGRRVASGLLDEFSGWDQASLVTLRAYSLSCARLESLQESPGDGSQLYRELRANLALLRELNLEKAER